MYGFSIKVNTACDMAAHQKDPHLPHAHMTAFWKHYFKLNWARPIHTQMECTEITFRVPLVRLITVPGSWVLSVKHVPSCRGHNYGRRFQAQTSVSGILIMVDWPAGWLLEVVPKLPLFMAG